MRVTVVEPRASGGMIHYAFQMSRALAAKGASVELITSRDYELEALDGGFRVRPILRLWSPTGGQPRPWPGRLGRALTRPRSLVRRAVRALVLVREWTRLTVILLRERPDIVQFGKVEFGFELVFFRILRARGITISEVCHEFERREQEDGALSTLEARLMDSAFKCFDVVFIHGEWNVGVFLDRHHNVPRSRICEIPHGNSELLLELRDGPATQARLMERYAPDGAPLVLFFGTLQPSKGLEDLVDAFAVVDRELDARLAIVGMPNKRFDLAGLKARISAAGISERLVLDPRYVPLGEVAELIESSRVVVLPYRNASQSGVLLSALTLGRPAIVTDVASLPETVVDGVTGIVAPPRRPDRIAAALMELLADPDRARRMGDAAAADARTRFAWGPIAETVLDSYRRIGSVRR